LLMMVTVTGAAVYVLLIRLFRLEQEEMEVILKIMPFLKSQRKKAAP
jgi:hypothetical protein